MGEAKRRTAYEILHPNSCVYCDRPATGRDHVPPKCLFSGDRSNLITVPACDEHNNSRSGADEKLRDYISVQTGLSDPAKVALWSKTRRSFARAPATAQQVLRSVTTEDGRERFALFVEASAVNRVLESMVRGLYWHHFGEKLPTDVPIAVAPLVPGAELPMDGLNVRRIGGDQFIYAYGRAEECPTASVWIFLFHGCVAACAETGRNEVD